VNAKDALHNNYFILSKENKERQEIEDADRVW